MSQQAPGSFDPQLAQKQYEAWQQYYAQGGAQPPAQQVQPSQEGPGTYKAYYDQTAPMQQPVQQAYAQPDPYGNPQMAMGSQYGAPPGNAPVFPPPQASAPPPMQGRGPPPGAWGPPPPQGGPLPLNSFVGGPPGGYPPYGGGYGMDQRGGWGRQDRGGGGDRRNGGGGGGRSGGGGGGGGGYRDREPQQSKNVLFFSGLPLNANEQFINDVFTMEQGDIEVGQNGEPRIKIYKEAGHSKGECTIIFRDEAVAQRVLSTYNG
uniref:RRM domain-containing protein n=1 Tax=Meloidogyne hapla TaxID=6305 RepID=A0A1I8C3U5_MELHA